MPTPEHQAYFRFYGELNDFLPPEDRGRTITYRFWVPRPFMPYLMKSFDAERCFSHFMPVTPVEDDLTLMWVLTSANFDKEDGTARITARNNDVFGEDVPIVNSQRPAMIPEALRQELHVRADKLSVVYRRWLAGLRISGAQ